MDKGVLVVKKPGQFQVLNLDQKLFLKNTLLQCNKKNPNLKTLDIKRPDNIM